MFLKTNWYGSFLIDGSQVVAYQLFPQDAEEIAFRYEQLRNGGVLKEERELVSGFTSVKVVESRLLKLGNTRLTEMTEAHTGLLDVLSPEKYGITQDLLRSALIIVASRKLKLTFAGRETTELIAALDDLNVSVNLLREREIEWRKVYTDSEMAVIFNDFTHQIHELEEYRGKLTSTLEKKMRDQNPTISTIVGELLGARLIARAGGLERLAKLPASTIQILGAENAFFRFQRTGKGMPKHGIIYQHPWIRGARKKFRGKIARTLAAKIALAARIDFFSDRDDGEILKQAVEKRILEISGGRKN